MRLRASQNINFITGGVFIILQLENNTYKHTIMFFNTDHKICGGWKFVYQNTNSIFFFKNPIKKKKTNTLNMYV